jgi:hypothetical protein
MTNKSMIKIPMIARPMAPHDFSMIDLLPRMCFDGSSLRANDARNYFPFQFKKELSHVECATPSTPCRDPDLNIRTGGLAD